MIAATTLLCWVAYLLGEQLHVSGVIATVTAGLIASWHQHTVMSAATRMRGTSFWTVLVFLMEATVFILIGLSLRDIVDRGGGFGALIETMAFPALAILVALAVARYLWVFGTDLAIRLANRLRLARSGSAGTEGRDGSRMGRRPRRGHTCTRPEPARRLSRARLYPRHVVCRDHGNGARTRHDTWNYNLLGWSGRS